MLGFAVVSPHAMDLVSSRTRSSVAVLMRVQWRRRGVGWLQEKRGAPDIEGRLSAQQDRHSQMGVAVCPHQLWCPAEHVAHISIGGRVVADDALCGLTNCVGR